MISHSLMFVTDVQVVRGKALVSSVITLSALIIALTALTVALTAVE